MSKHQESLTGQNHFISLPLAAQMTRRYRAEKEQILVPELRNTNTLLICETFDRSAFDTLLAQDGCVGLRVYFGMKDNLQVRAIVVGVNARNEDMVPSSVVLDSGDPGGVIVEEGQPCPELCPPGSPLNED